MKSLVILAMSFLTSAAFAATSYDWAMGILQFNDSRITLTTCGTNEGTYAFTHPKDTTVFTCSGDVTASKTPILWIQRAGSKAVFAVSNCGQQTGAAEQEAGNVKQKCQVQQLDSASLAPTGKKGAITYSSSWEYSSGSTSFAFKMNNISFSGTLVDFDTLSQDQ